MNYLTQKNGGTQKMTNQAWLTENIRPVIIAGRFA
jgi:hypothetical protein